MTKEEKIAEVIKLVNHHSDWVCAMANSYGVEDFEKKFEGKCRTEVALKYKLRELIKDDE